MMIEQSLEWMTRVLRRRKRVGKSAIPAADAKPKLAFAERAAYL